MTDTRAKIIPNTFMMFNVYVDALMEHLIESELRVLIYACRHILGWQDKVNSRQGFISQSMFEDGYTTENGTRFAGCGLGKASIRDACNSLVALGVLIRVGEPTQKGQLWQIGDSPKWDEIERRTNERKAKRKDQTKKATAASIAKRQEGTLNDTPQGGTLDDSPPPNVERYPRGYVRRPQTKPCSKPCSKYLT